MAITSVASLLPALFLFISSGYIIRYFPDSLGFYVQTFIAINLASVLDFGLVRYNSYVVARELNKNVNGGLKNAIGMTLFFVVLYMGALHLLIQIGFGSSDGIFISIKDMGLLGAIFVANSGLRGILEGQKKFKDTAKIQTIHNLIIYASPIGITKFNLDNGSFIAVILLTKFVYLILQSRIAFMGINVNNLLPSIPNKEDIKFIFGLSTSNVIGNIILYLDKVVVGSFPKSDSVTRYLMTSDFIGRLQIFPSIVTSVMFPELASMKSQYKTRLGESFLFYAGLMVVGVSAMLSIPFSYIWVGEINETVISTFIVSAVGLYLLSRSAMAMAVINAKGQSINVAVIHAFELSVYGFAVYAFYDFKSIFIVQLIWLFRMLLDAILISNAIVENSDSIRLRTALLVVIYFVASLFIFISGEIVFIFFGGAVLALYALYKSFKYKKICQI